MLGLGDSISAFMGRIGRGDRIFVVLSDKYLRSPHCLFELCEIWRNSKEERALLLERVRVYTLPDSKIWTLEDRLAWALHWRERTRKIAAQVAEHGDDILGERLYLEYMQMQRFGRQVGTILSTLADIVQPRQFEEFERWGFADPAA